MSEPSQDFIEDCMKYRGRLLTGKYRHWCPDWDFLPIDETCPEFPCGCEKFIEENWLKNQT